MSKNSKVSSVNTFKEWLIGIRPKADCFKQPVVREQSKYYNKKKY